MRSRPGRRARRKRDGRPPRSRRTNTPPSSPPRTLDHPPPSRAEAVSWAPVTRTYVLDTSVLLADPHSLFRFAEHDVVLPVVVVSELEAKRDHPDLGWAARQALRRLERFRVDAGSLTEPLVANPAGGTLRVELNHQDTAGLPSALAADNNDHRILAVARNLADEGRDVVVVTKDLPLRLKCSIAGLPADEYRNELVSDSSWTGF